MRTLTHHCLHSFLASWDTLTQTKEQIKHGFKQRPELICSLQNNGGFADGSIVQVKDRLFAAAERFFSQRLFGWSPVADGHMQPHWSLIWRAVCSAFSRSGGSGGAHLTHTAVNCQSQSWEVAKQHCWALASAQPPAPSAATWRLWHSTLRAPSSWEVLSKLHSLHPIL